MYNNDLAIALAENTQEALETLEAIKESLDNHFGICPELVTQTDIHDVMDIRIGIDQLWRTVQGLQARVERRLEKQAEERYLEICSQAEINGYTIDENTSHYDCNRVKVVSQEVCYIAGIGHRPAYEYQAFRAGDGWYTEEKQIPLNVEFA